MENHLHIILQCDNMSETIRTFNSYTARAIVDYFTERNFSALLEKLKYHKLMHKTKSTYQLWQEGSHPEEFTTDEMMHTKIEYIHNNPVRRGYVDEAREWRYFPHQ